MYSVLSWQLREDQFKRLRSLSRQVRIGRQHERYMTSIISITYAQEDHKEICITMYPVGGAWDIKCHRKIVTCDTCGVVLRKWLLHDKIETAVVLRPPHRNCHAGYLGSYETYYNGKQYSIRYHIYREYSVLRYVPYMTDSHSLYCQVFENVIND